MGVKPIPIEEQCISEIRERLLELEGTDAIVELILEGGNLVIGNIPSDGVSTATVRIINVRGNEIECTVSICCVCAVCTVPPEA